MRRLLAAATALAVLTLACTEDADSPPAAVVPDDPNCPAELAGPLRAWGEAGYRGVVAIATGGEFDCRWATGTDDGVDTVFGIGSVSKAFTAAAVLDLVDAGTLARTDRAGDLVPGLTGPVADATVEQLLLHTSGLVGTHAEDGDPVTHDAAIAAISRLGLAFPPGTDYLYSNGGYTLLALIVEAVTGSYQDYERDHVLTAGGDFTNPYWAVAGNGDLAMTVTQLTEWTHALFTGPLGDEIRTPGWDHGDGSAVTPGWLAFDADLFGVPFLATAGGGGDTGENAAVAYLPDADVVVAMASSADSGLRAEDLLRAIGPALAVGDPIPTPTEPVEVDPAVLEDAAGDYDGYTVAVDDDGLLITAETPAAVATLFPRPDGADDHEAAVLAALRGETGPGRDELATLADGIGEVEDVELVGTILAEGELRTYVVLTVAGGERQLAWYALDEAGGIAGADLTDEPPTMRFVPAAGDRFVPDDPTGTGPDVVVTFDGDDLVVG